MERPCAISSVPPRSVRSDGGSGMHAAIAFRSRSRPETARRTAATRSTVLDEFGADDVAPLRNGCVCCTVRVKLQDRLRRLLAERAQGQVPHFSRVVIRTGEDPGPIRRMFASPRALGIRLLPRRRPDAQVARSADALQASR